MHRVFASLNDWRDRTALPFIDRYLLHVGIAAVIAVVALIVFVLSQPSGRVDTSPPPGPDVPPRSTATP